MTPDTTNTNTRQTKEGLLRWWPQLVGTLLILFVAGWLKYDEDNYHEKYANTKALEIDPYQELGISAKATRAEVRKAHRELNLEWHPDRRESCDDACHQKFNRINEAVKILSSPELRKMYDESRKVYTTSSSKFTSGMQPFEYELSEATWTRLVQPSVHGVQLMMDDHISGSWAIVVADSSSEYTESFLNVWSDLAARFYGRVSFMRGDTKKGNFDKLLPVRIQVSPAIIMLNPNDQPAVWSNFHNFRPQVLADWLEKNMPNPIEPYRGSISDLRKMIISNQADQYGRIPLVLATDMPPSSAIKAFANRYWSLFNIMSVPLSKPGVMKQLLGPQMPPQLPKNGGYLIAHSYDTTMQIKHLPKGLFTLDQMRYRNRETNEVITETQAGKALKILKNTADQIINGTVVTAYAESYKYLCPEKCIVHQTRPSEKTKNENMTDIVFPMRRLFASSSPLYKALNANINSTIVLDWKTPQITINGVDTPIKKVGNLFPQLALRTWEQLFHWCMNHPIMITLITSGTYGAYTALKFFLAWRSKSKKE